MEREKKTGERERDERERKKQKREREKRQIFLPPFLVSNVQDFLTSFCLKSFLSFFVRKRKREGKRRKRFGHHLSCSLFSSYLPSFF